MLPPVREAVETGKYASSSEVVRDALRDCTTGLLAFPPMKYSTDWNASIELLPGRQNEARLALAEVRH